MRSVMMGIKGWIWIIEIINLFLFGLFIKNYLPSYMGKKGENLATKQDIAEITRKSEEVQDEFRREYKKFSSDMQFKYDFYYKQYVELYTKLYSIICQSEYLRRFFHLYDGTDFAFDETPFIEIIKKTSVSKIESVENNITNVNTEYTKRDNITNFCKKELSDLIINKGEFASQKLLKLAVAYRFAHDNYSGNEEIKVTEISNLAGEEEFILITEIVKTIIHEYNMLRKELKMDFIESEISNSKFESIIIGSNESINE
jgi:hypothetical protein